MYEIKTENNMVHLIREDKSAITNLTKREAIIFLTSNDVDTFLCGMFKELEKVDPQAIFFGSQFQEMVQRHITPFIENGNRMVQLLKPEENYDCSGVHG